MGILINGLSIILGSLFGNKFIKVSQKTLQSLGICIMLLCMVGFFENMFRVEGENLMSKNLLLILFSYFIGGKIGDFLRLEDRLSHLGKTKNSSFNAIIDTTLFFGVGGLQISGPILMAIHGDHTQLLLKSIIDFPFAIAFGAAYGKIAAISAAPVALIQGLIATMAYFFAFLFNNDITMQICAMGYIILFFSGFNLLSSGKYKINNINMLPSFLILILLNYLIKIAEMIR